MVLQVPLGRESFQAAFEGARVRLEALVHVHVVFEAVLLEELLSALSALIFRLFIALR